MQLQDLKISAEKCPDIRLSDKLTIVIPFRMDCMEREANLMTILRHVSTIGCRTIVLEADYIQNLKNLSWQNVEYIFMKDKNQKFHRTAYINLLMDKSDTDVVAVWDTDVLIDLPSVMEAIHHIYDGSTIVYPYNGEFVMLSEQLSIQIRRKPDMNYLNNARMVPVFRRPFCGGVFLAHKQRYFECGGENENFTGWGPEDAERLRRVRILGHDVKWIVNRQAYHLWHPRGNNSFFFTKDDEIRLKLELAKVSSMDKKELQTYISDSKWHITKI